MRNLKKMWKAAMALTLSAAITCSGIPMTANAAQAQTSNEVTEREQRNSDLSKTAAGEGIVLLENKDKTLPLKKASNIALFGGAAYATIKGGTGSGDVNQRELVSIFDGLENKGFTFTNKDWYTTFAQKLQLAKDEQKSNDYITFIKGTFGGSPSYVANDFAYSDAEIAKAKEGTDTAVYTISRISGEGEDRIEKKGDYYLSDVEKENLIKISSTFEKVIVLLNVGGIIDTKFFSEINGLDAMVLVSQGGQRGGDAVAEMLDGTINPSGKLTDTWALNYMDYPSSATFGLNDNNPLQEEYTEDIYNGYRYFDTFGKKAAYEFGYGMSYTTFEITNTVTTLSEDKSMVNVKVMVENTGDCAGKEVVQVYYSAPDGTLEKPYQNLAVYGKTDLLSPGQSQTLNLSYKVNNMASYNMAEAAYVLEAGDYLVRVGNSSRNTQVSAKITLDKTVKTEQLTNHKVIDKDITVLTKKDAIPYTYTKEAEEIASAAKLTLDASSINTVINITGSNEDVTVYVSDTTETKYLFAENKEGAAAEIILPGYSKAIKKDTVSKYNEKVKKLDGDFSKNTLLDVYNGTITMEQFVSGMTLTELSNLVVGSKSSSGTAAENSVKGTSGETTGLYLETKKIPNTTLADGPAGVRLTNNYEQDGVKYYQYCTAWPIGTMLTQTWNDTLIEEVGKAVGEEMKEYGVTFWLAPGMNIHRNPLNGRNFEYYSEDPFLTGSIGTAMTKGVQSNPGVGVSIKHYAGNSQEQNRNDQNNTITERAFREIYLKGFEYVVRQAKPMAIMASYNENNSIPASDDYELCTLLPRGEWGFDGIIMTDWGGGQSTPMNSMHAGNDLIMPGGNPAKITAGFQDTEPTFTEDGYVTTSGDGTWANPFVDNWGSYVLSPSGNKTFDTTVATGTAINAKVNIAIDNGAASKVVKENGDTVITYKAYLKKISLGDVQKSAIHILNVIMESNQFAKITGQTAPAYTTKRAYKLETLYSLTKSSAIYDNVGGYVPGNPTTDDKEDETTKKPAEVDVEIKETVKANISTKSVNVTENKDGFFYTKDGKKIIDAIVVAGNNRYILNNKGEKYISSMVNVGSSAKYIVDDMGKVIKGSFVTAGSAKYYTTKATGKVVTNKLFKVEGKKYFAGKTGKLTISKWVTVGTKKYYCNNVGVITKTKKATSK